MNISTRPTLNSIVVKLAGSVVLVASLGLFSSSSEAATLIPVDNPGFVYTAVSGTRTGETEPIDTFTEGFGAGVPLIDSSAPPNSDCTLGGCVQDGTADVLGWTGMPSSFVGAENLPADAWAGTLVPDGAAAFAGGVFTGQAGTFTQVVPATSIPDAPGYRLTVQLFERRTIALPQDILVQLRSGGNDLGGTLTIDPFVDGASLATLLIPGLSVPSNSDLEILLGAADSTGRIQVAFDNVMLEAVPVPPAVWLFVSSLLGLFGIARRKKPA